MNPATQFELWITLFITKGLSTGTTSGKATFIRAATERPQFIEALIATIFFEVLPSLNVLCLKLNPRLHPPPLFSYEVWKKKGGGGGG